MWIVPNNHLLHSRFALDTVESKEDLSLLESSLMSSLMWRSKPSPLRTWSQRWSRESWLRHLFGRTLKPCQWSRFETELTSSLAATHASLLVPQGSVKEIKMSKDDISGPISETSSEQYDLFGFSAKTSKVISQSACEKSLVTWKALVTQRRLEYSARLKLAHLTRESACTSPEAGNDAGWRSAKLADSQRERSQGGLSRREDTQRESELRHTGSGSSAHGQPRQETRWDAEPNVGRVVDGVANRVDRIRLLGNSVVPQTAAKAWQVLNDELSN